MVQHAGKEKSFDYASSCSYDAHYLAFYSDVKHEIKPVTQGYRLALVYNLISLEKTKMPLLKYTLLLYIF